jgi:hypothetical protein
MEKTKNQLLFEEAEAAISRFTGDLSVSPQETRSSLEALVVDIQAMIDAINEDLEPPQD